MKCLGEMKFEKTKSIVLNAMLAFISSCWILPLAAGVFCWLPEEISELESKSKAFESLLTVIAIVGYLYFFVVWFMWSFILIKRFRSLHTFDVSETTKKWKLAFISLLSIAWIFFLWFFVFLYCTIRMKNQSIDLISSGAHIFYMIRSSMTWALLFFSIVLWRLILSVLKRL